MIKETQVKFTEAEMFTGDIMNVVVPDNFNYATSKDVEINLTAPEVLNGAVFNLFALKNGTTQLNFGKGTFDVAGQFNGTFTVSSLIDTIRVVPDFITKPTIVSPLSQTFDCIASVPLQWTPQEGRIKYSIEVAIDSAMKNVIRSDQTINNAKSENKTVFSYDPKSKAAEDYMNFAKELKEKLDAQ